MTLHLECKSDPLIVHSPDDQGRPPCLYNELEIEFSNCTLHVVPNELTKDKTLLKCWITERKHAK